MRKDLGVVLVLATVGVLAAAACTVLGMRFLAGWSWSAALVFGVLISATDPVSVIAIFKASGTQGRLRVLVEAESLFNDGTVAVLFGLALAVVSGQAVPGGELVWGFLCMVIGGVLCGALVGGLVLLLVGRTHDHLVEITFTTVAAYGSFMVAEHFGLSEVLATLTAGVVVGNLGPLGVLSERGRGAVDDFWEYAAFVANSLVFLLMGAQLAGRGLAEAWLPIVIAIGVVLVGRAVSVYGCNLLWRWSAWKVSARHQHLLFWGGLRGALALALALGLPEDMADRSLVVTTAFGVVAFSLLVQGLTITAPLKKDADTGLPAPEAGS